MHQLVEVAMQILWCQHSHLLCPVLPAWQRTAAAAAAGTPAFRHVRTASGSARQHHHNKNSSCSFSSAYVCNVQHSTAHMAVQCRLHLTTWCIHPPHSCSHIPAVTVTARMPVGCPVSYCNPPPSAAPAHTPATQAPPPPPRNPHPKPPHSTKNPSPAAHCHNTP